MTQLVAELMVKILILLGIILLLFWLVITNQLILYIHPRFVNLIEVSGYILFLMLLMQCRDLKKAWNQPMCRRHGHIMWWNYLPFILMLIISFALPNSSLNASLVNNKGLNSKSPTEAKEEYRPLAAELQQKNPIQVSEHNFAGVISEINHFPKDYVGKKIEMSEFIYKNVSAATNRFSLVRYMIVCCTADALAYGLLCEVNDSDKYTEGNWYQIQGVIQMELNQGKSIPIIKITQMKQFDEPANPYIYP